MHLVRESITALFDHRGRLLFILQHLPHNGNLALGKSFCIYSSFIVAQSYAVILPGRLKIKQRMAIVTSVEAASIGLGLLECARLGLDSAEGSYMVFAKAVSFLVIKYTTSLIDFDYWRSGVVPYHTRLQVTIAKGLLG